MNDFDLKSKIRSIQAPERSGEYWEEFPERVLAQARVPSVRRDETGQLSRMFILGMRYAFASLAVIFCLWQSGMPRTLSHVLRQDEMQLRHEVHQFHRNLGLFMQDEHGLHNLIEDKS